MGKVITPETRGAIISEVIAFGKPLSEVAKRHNVHVETVRNAVRIAELVKNREFDALKEMTTVKGLSVSGIAWTFEALGVEPPKGYFDELRELIQDRRAKYELAAIKKEEEKNKPVEEATPPTTEETPIPEKQPTGTKAYIPAASAEMGWQTRIKTNPNKICMTVYFNGVPVVEGFSRIKENSELALMQAISYAAHMCYKITEQKKLSGR